MPKVKTAQSFDTNAESKFHLSAQGFPFKNKAQQWIPDSGPLRFRQPEPIENHLPNQSLA